MLKSLDWEAGSPLFSKERKLGNLRQRRNMNEVESLLVELGPYCPLSKTQRLTRFSQAGRCQSVSDVS